MDRHGICVVEMCEQERQSVHIIMVINQFAVYDRLVCVCMCVID